MPTTGTIHVGSYRCHIFDYPGVFPSLELEIIGFRMSLVTHLGHNLILLCRTHHKFNFIERARHWFFHIYVNTM